MGGTALPGQPVPGQPVPGQQVAGQQVAEQQAAPARWHFRAALGRVSRWFFYSVILALFPVAISLASLPKKTSVTMLLSHGDLAVLASALVAVSMGELIGSKELRQNGIYELLFGACLLFWTSSIVLFSFIAGNNQNFTPNTEFRYSWYLLLAAVVTGMGSFAATVART
jgi:hypothetical protein